MNIHETIDSINETLREQAARELPMPENPTPEQEWEQCMNRVKRYEELVKETFKP